MASYDHHPGFYIDDAASIAYKVDLETAVGRPFSGGKLLELGCGSGGFTTFLVSLGASVTGIDKNEEHLSQARQTLPNAAFFSGDIESLDFAETLTTTHGTFDCLIARYVIHELTDPIETFNLWKQVLNPGGKLILIENCWVRSDWGWSEWGKRSDQLPLACTQTWATAAYCLKKAGLTVSACQWMNAVNQLENTRMVSGFRLYIIVADISG